MLWREELIECTEQAPRPPLGTSDTGGRPDQMRFFVLRVSPVTPRFSHFLPWVHSLIPSKFHNSHSCYFITLPPSTRHRSSTSLSLTCYIYYAHVTFKRVVHFAVNSLQKSQKKEKRKKRNKNKWSTEPMHPVKSTFLDFIIFTVLVDSA